ncbi:MAG: transcription repressor NadR [Peptococcales bacterium]|jgi:transcriptional regulator of NAD metabolism
MVYSKKFLLSIDHRLSTIDFQVSTFTYYIGNIYIEINLPFLFANYPTILHNLLVRELFKMPRDRRQEIINILKDISKPIKGNQLADFLGVSRQVIVQDIALLRAEGKDIIATPQGYFLISKVNNDSGKLIKVFACQHDHQNMEKELKIIVSLGGKVVDVIVEHPLYGELKGNLMLENLEDVESFIKNLDKSGAGPLSALTKGIHLHTIEAPSQVILDKIQEELKSAGLLVVTKN